MANPLVCIFNPITTLIDQIPSSSVFTGAGAAGTPVVLNTLGVIDPSFLGEGLDATAGELLVAGALINLYNNAGSLYMQNAYAAAIGTAPSGHAYPVDAVGFVANNTSVSNASLVLFSGTFTYADPNSEFTANNIGAEVYLRATPPAGGVTLTAPSGAGQISQSVGNVVGFTAPNFVLISYIASPQPPFSTPGGSATQVQFNKGGGVFGGIPGSVVDGTNGLTTLAPTGAGVALTIVGDSTNAHDILDLKSNGASYSAAQFRGGFGPDNAGIQLTLTDTGSGSFINLIPGSTANFFGALVSINPSSIATGVGLQVFGDNSASNDVAQFNIFGGTPAVEIDTNGNLVLNFALIDGTSSPGTSGQVLSSTVTGTAWITPSGGGGSPGGSNGEIQFNDSGSFNGAPFSFVNTSTGATAIGVSTRTPTSTTALTANGAGAHPIQEWYSANEGFVVANLDYRGILFSQGVEINNTINFAEPALKVTGGVSGSPDIAQFWTNLTGTPANTKVVWVDINGNLNLLEGLKDHTGSLGTSGQVLSTTGTQTTWVTPSGSPASPSSSIQFNNAGAFGGSANFEWNGTTVQLTGAINTSGPDLMDMYTFGAFGVNAGIAVLQYGDSRGLGINIQDALNNQTYIQPGNLVVTGYSEGSVQILPTAGVLAMSIVATPLLINMGTGTGVALSVQGDAHANDLLDMYSAAIVGSVFNVNQWGGTTIAPPAGSTTVALSVTGDPSSSNILNLYQNGFPSQPAAYLDTGGSFWIQNVVTPTDTIQLYDTTFEILSATGQAQASLSGVPHFHLSSTIPAVMDLYTSYLGFGGAASDTFLSRLSAGVFGVGQTAGTTTGTLATGGVAYGIVTKTTTYTATEFDHTINCNGTFTVTLPTVGIVVGQEYYIKNIGTGVITVSSSVNIDFTLTQSLNTQGQSITVQWDGTQYWIY